MSITTKTGDDGKTGLVGGVRVSKADPRVDLYGDVDELNSHVGLCLALLDQKKFPEIMSFLSELQSILFNLGSLFACEVENREKYKIPVITDKSVKEIEDLIQKIEVKLPILKNFIMPGGAHCAAQIHLTRTVARRVERKMISVEARGETLPENSKKFMNRLSDYLFLAARHVNQESGIIDTPWISKQ